MAMLVLRREVGGLRHYLDGKPVHAGTGLLLELEGGAVVPGRYEWSFEKEERPAFYIETAGGGEACIWLPESAPLRWPTERAW